MFIYDEYDDSYDIKQLQHLLTFRGMTEKEIRTVVRKMSAMESEQWEAELAARLADERKKTLAYAAELEAGKKYPPLPTDQVQIQWGITVSPDMVDDRGFVSSDNLAGRKRTLRLFLDDKRKIYIGK